MEGVVAGVVDDGGGGEGDDDAAKIHTTSPSHYANNGKVKFSINKH